MVAGDIKTKKSRRPRMEPSWLDRPALKRAEEWGKNLEALTVPGFFMSLLEISINLAWGATEEVKDDCILIRFNDRIKILPLVSDWEHYDHIVRREAKTFRRISIWLCSQGSRTWLGEGFDDCQGATGVCLSSRERFRVDRQITPNDRKDVRSLKGKGVTVEPIGEHNLSSVLECNERWFLRNQGNRLTYNRGRTIWAFRNASLLELIGVKQIAAVLDGDVIGYKVAGPLGASRVALTYGRGDTEPRA